ncbi:MAG: Arylsulfatase, partial [Verrucomicrobiota bacterium]
DLGCYQAGSRIPTPHLDRLAAQGARFTDAHSSSGVCTPSRYALLTGRHHWRDFHGIVNAFGPPVFRPGQLTLPAMLRQRGYATAAIGKWHLGWDWDAIRRPGVKPISTGKGGSVWGPDGFDWSQPIPGGPLARGFDHYFGDDVINFPPYCWIQDDRVVTAPDTQMDSAKWRAIKEGNWESRPGPMTSDWDPYQNLPTLTRRGVDYLRARRGSDRPFFLYFAFPSPHAPIIPNDAFDGKSRAGAFGDFVHETDDAVGQILRALEDSGHAENTMVLFSADNGPERYAYARDERYGHWSSHPLRGLKRDLYEGGHRVPFLVRWPGIVRPGTVCDALVSQVDIMATLAGIAGYDLPPNSAEDSHDLLPLLRGETAPVRTAHVHNTNANGYAIRAGDWVLILARDGYVSTRDRAWESRHKYSADDTAEVELYNLRVDLAQRHNVATAHPARVAELTALLQQLRAQGHSAPRLTLPRR